MFSSNQRFAEGVSVINAVDEARFPLLMGRVAQGLTGTSQAFTQPELEKLQVSLELEQSSLSLLLDSLNYILRQAAFSVVKPASLRDQLISASVTEEKASVCAEVWANVAKSSIDALRQRSLYPMELADIKWSLGARLSSSAQSGQGRPIAKLQLSMSSTEEREPITLQMQHEDLFEFYSELERVQAHLDALK